MKKARFFPWYVYLLLPVVLFSVSFFFVWTASHNSPTQNVVMGDRNLLVTAPDVFEAAKSEHGYRPRGEIVRKEKLPRGGRSLSYLYADEFLSVKSLVVAELDTASAAVTFKQLADSEITHEGQTLQKEEWPSPAGDSRVIGAIMSGPTAVGNVFLERKGTRIVLYRVEGATLLPSDAFQRLVQLRLSLTDTFSAR